MYAYFIKQSVTFSLESLTHLKELNLQKNDFSTGALDVVGKFQSLQELNLQMCNLSALPSR